MRHRIATLILASLLLVSTSCSSQRYIPPPTAVVPVDPQVAIQRQVTALSANMSSLQAQITRNNSQIAELSKLNDSLFARIAELKKAPATPAASSPPSSADDSTAAIADRVAFVEAKATTIDTNERQLDARLQAVERRLGLR